MYSFARDFVQVSRPGWWLVTVWLYIAPCQTQQIDLAGLFFVLLPLNVMIYGINDSADLGNDVSNDRKGNFVFGPKGWSRERLNRILTPTIWMTFLLLLYWDLEGELSLQYMLWFAMALIINYLYNFHSSSLNLLLVFIGYGSVTVLSYWRHGGIGFGLERARDGRWYFAGCNQEYWIHLTLLLVRSQLWAELMDYESDLRTKKWTTLSGLLPTKGHARLLVLGILALELLWCLAQHQIHKRDDWFMLLAFSTMGMILFTSLEYLMPPFKNVPEVDLTFLATMQNAGGMYLLHDCWRRGTFVK
jgi:4-hydroxybenzoate polyprenyltransferase